MAGASPELRADRFSPAVSSWWISGRLGAARAVSSAPSSKGLEYPDIVFGKVDTDDQQRMAMAAQITSVRP